MAIRKVKLSKSRFLTIVYVFLIFLGVARTYIKESVNVSALPVNKKNIVVDAGHGGWDPGKVTSEGVEEKTINLEIAKKLQGYLEQGGAVVNTSRVEDIALSKNKRVDLKSRKELVDENVDMFVSVHQNAFPNGKVKGAQVFYYKDSEDGKVLAQCIQNRLKEVVDVDNTRVPKPNNEYYLLKNTKIPSVIVECGFLSNSSECNNLSDEKYQDRVAWAIYMGILDYFGERAV